MATNRAELEAAASDVIQILKTVPEFASCRVAVIGGLALWKFMPQGRTTEDVDFIINIDTAPNTVKAKLLSLSDTNFTERAQFFYYKAPSGKLIQIDITPAWQSPYFPQAASVISTIPKGVVPYITPADLILFKINSCGLRAEPLKKRRDGMDAFVLLEEMTRSGPLNLTQKQQSKVQPGLEDVITISGKDKQWWKQRLGL